MVILVDIFQLYLEKIIFLLKGLHKSVRKSLIPIPQTAGKILQRMRLYKGSLYRSLEQIIFENYRIRIDPHLWPISELPDYLKMRFCLIDQSGKTVKASRSLTQLFSLNIKPSARESEQLASLRRIWEHEDITITDLITMDAIPEKLPVLDGRGNLTGFAYSGLNEKGGHVSLKLFTADKERKKQTRSALLSLYLMHFKNHAKGLKKDLSITRKQWVLHEGIASHENINDQIYLFILEIIFGTRDGIIPDREAIKNKVREIEKKGLYPLAREIFDAVVALLTERRKIRDAISLLAKGKAGIEPSVYTKRLDEIVPHNFLEHFSMHKLKQSMRYMQALSIRIERARVSPGKDIQKAAAVIPFAEHLAQLEEKEITTGEKQQLLDEYREMIEEFNISLFAQEVKTLYPVSEKRLLAKRREIELAGL